MASKASQDKNPNISSDTPKAKQLVQMLSFRIVPAFFKEVEKVADKKNMTVSKLIRTYIKEGLRKDNELNSSEDKDFRIE